MTQSYGYQYHTYPVFAEEMSHEGAVKKFERMPGPKEVFDMAMRGLPKKYPLTGEPIEQSEVEPYLSSAIAEIEMKLNCNLSEVTQFHSEDYIDGMFGGNWMGINLRSWPATEITQVQFKFPHANTQSTYQTYTIPAPWIYLRRNKMNVVAGVGAVTASVDNSNIASAGGIFSYISGFARGAYQPGTMEVVYKSGFKHDQLPANVADLVKTWAARRFLIEIFPVLFPTSSTNVSIDGVSQGVTYGVTQMLVSKLEMLDKKILDLTASLKNQYGKSVAVSFVGA